MICYIFRLLKISSNQNDLQGFYVLVAVSNLLYFCWCISYPLHQNFKNLYQIFKYQVFLSLCILNISLFEIVINLLYLLCYSYNWLFLDSKNNWYDQWQFLYHFMLHLHLNRVASSTWFPWNPWIVLGCFWYLICTWKTTAFELYYILDFLEFCLCPTPKP